jgi:hypothetical protein
MTLRRTLIAALTAAALVAPAAQAQPDMHASVAQAAAKANQQSKQDLRSPDARDAAVPSKQALPSPDARDAAVSLHSDGGGGTAPDSASQLPPASRPTLPTNPSPIVAAAPEPASDGSPLPVVPLVAGLLGVMVAALAARYGIRRSGRRTRIAA